MYTVTLIESCCTGFPEWKGKTFRGVGMSRSVSKAAKKAYAALVANFNTDPDMAAETPVYNEYSIVKGTKAIKSGHSFSDLISY